MGGSCHEGRPRRFRRWKLIPPSVLLRYKLHLFRVHAHMWTVMSPVGILHRWFSQAFMALWFPGPLSSAGRNPTEKQTQKRTSKQQSHTQNKQDTFACLFV